MYQFLKKSFFKKNLSLVLLALIIVVHITLLLKTFIVDSQGNMRAAAAGYGDIPFHMTQVSKFAYQKHIDFNEPIFDGERLRYAFFINLISGLILRISGNWFISMQAPVVGFMSTAIILMFIMYRRFLKSYLGAAAAVFVFLFGSGFGANYLIQKDLFSASRTIPGFFSYLIANNLSTITKWNAVFPDQNIGWGSPMSLVLLHQRAFILGFFIFTLFLFLLQKWKNNPNSNLLTILLGTTIGISPLAHYHTFVVMTVIIGFVAIKSVIKKERDFLIRLVILGTIILFFSLPQIFYLTQGKDNLLISDQSFIKFRMGWMTEATTGSAKFSPELGFLYGKFLPYLNFLWVNFGVILPLFIVSLFFTLKSHKFRESYPLALNFLILGASFFIIVQLIRFQPWDYDDNKILVYFQFFAAPVLVAFFIWISKKTKLLGYILFVVFLLIATYSGIVDQIPRLLVASDNIPVIFSKDSILTAEYIQNNVPEKDKIITSSTHLNIVASLSGRPVLLGYPGWLWTRGIDYSTREQNLRQYYSDPLLYRGVADFYHAKYVLIDSAAINDWKANVDILSSVSDLLYSQGQYQLYRLH